MDAQSQIIRVLAGRVSRRVVRRVLVPGATVFYYGGLIYALGRFPGVVDWQSDTISHLALYRWSNPDYFVASGGMLLCGACLFPIGGYVARRLWFAAPSAASIGRGCFHLGATCTVVEGALSFWLEPSTADIHTAVARASALFYALAMILFWVCALRGARRRPAEPVSEPSAPCTSGGPTPPPVSRLRRGRRLRGQSVFAWLAVLWTIPALAGPLAAFMSVLCSDRQVQNLTGFYEWLATFAMFLFLVTAAALLPAEAP